ncbi:MAG: TonB family protein [Sphingorhabdus sp.]
MSYASETKRTNPASLALAIGVNGSIILAVALSPVVVERIKGDPFIGKSIELQPPPPDLEKPDEKKPDVDTKPLEKIFTPTPEIKKLPNPENEIRTGNDPIKDTTVADGKGGGEVRIKDPVIIPDPPPAIFRGAVRDPRFAKDFQPAYPPGLLQREIEGTASIRVLIGTDGRVREAQVVSASHPDFGQAAVRQALKSWRFKPATRGDAPVEDWQTLSVRFTID